MHRKGNHITESKLAKRRTNLQAKIDAFIEQTPTKLDTVNQDLSYRWPDRDSDDGCDDSDEGSDDEDCDFSDGEEDDEEDHNPGQDSEICPESLILPLPSMMKHKDNQDNDVLALVEQEVNLRKAQAAEALQHLRLCLGIKSAMFRKNLRPAKSQKTKMRAWRSIQHADTNVRFHARQYKIARDALVRLDVLDDGIIQFPELKKEDLKMSRDVVEENRVGQRNEHVSWVWRSDVGKDGVKDDWMNESVFK
jgi:hypothetical protein